MTTEEITTAIDELQLRRSAAIEKLIQYSKALETQLRDLKQENTADRLSAVLGELEQLDVEFLQLFRNNPRAAAELFLSGLKGRTPPL